MVEAKGLRAMDLGGVSMSLAVSNSPGRYLRSVRGRCVWDGGGAHPGHRKDAQPGVGAELYLVTSPESWAALTRGSDMSIIEADEILVTLFDKDLLNDDFLGEVRIPLQTISTQRVSDTWYDLDPAGENPKPGETSQGSLRLRLHRWQVTS